MWVPLHTEEPTSGRNVLLHNEGRQGKWDFICVLKVIALRPVTAWKDAVTPAGRDSKACTVVRIKESSFKKCHPHFSWRCKVWAPNFTNANSTQSLGARGLKQLGDLSHCSVSFFPKTEPGMSSLQMIAGLVAKSCPTLGDPMNAHQAPPSMGFSTARILEWVAIPFSRASSPPRDRTQLSCTAGRFVTD